MVLIHRQLWQLYLTQALMYGIGSSMFYFPIMSITPVYFDRHRGFAMGAILAGSGVGGIVMGKYLQSVCWNHYSKADSSCPSGASRQARHSMGSPHPRHLELCHRDSSGVCRPP